MSASQEGKCTSNHNIIHESGKYYGKQKEKKPNTDYILFDSISYRIFIEAKFISGAFQF